MRMGFRLCLLCLPILLTARRRGNFFFFSFFPVLPFCPFFLKAISTTRFLFFFFFSLHFSVHRCITVEYWENGSIIF